VINSKKLLEVVKENRFVGFELHTDPSMARYAPAARSGNGGLVAACAPGP